METQIVADDGVSENGTIHTMDLITSRVLLLWKQVVCCNFREVAVKVMFSQVSVCHFVQGAGNIKCIMGYGRVPPQTLDLGTYPTAGDIWWLSLETYSNLFIWGPNPLKVISDGDN